MRLVLSQRLRRASSRDQKVAESWTVDYQHEPPSIADGLQVSCERKNDCCLASASQFAGIDVHRFYSAMNHGADVVRGRIGHAQVHASNAGQSGPSGDGDPQRPARSDRQRKKR